jgi:hypothetical protein
MEIFNIEAVYFIFLIGSTIQHSMPGGSFDTERNSKK